MKSEGGKLLDVYERRLVLSIWILSFGFVSDFDIRISDFLQKEANHEPR